MASKEADNETHKRETPKPSRPLPKLDTSLLYSTRIASRVWIGFVSQKPLRQLYRVDQAVHAREVGRLRVARWRREAPAGRGRVLIANLARRRVDPRELALHRADRHQAAGESRRRVVVLRARRAAPERPARPRVEGVAVAVRPQAADV